MMQLRTQNELSRRPLQTCKRDRSNFGTSGCSFSGLALLAFARFFLARSFNAAKAWLSKVCAVADSGPQSLRATAIDLNECDLSGAMQDRCNKNKIKQGNTCCNAKPLCQAGSGTRIRPPS